MPSVCVYGDCEEPTETGHSLCDEHYQDKQEGAIDLCQTCGKRYKVARFRLCLRCYLAQRASRRSEVPRPEQMTGGAEAAWPVSGKDPQFFVYVLKLDDGQFYVGQTNSLRERLSEHKDGKTRTTRGKNPKLQWFVAVPSRASALMMETELDALKLDNERALRRMIIQFSDLVEELQFD